VNREEFNRGGGFPPLSPDLILGLVESVLGCSCTNLCRPLNSYINRVYELETREGEGLIAKLYRPGRWSRSGIQDEHDFLLELADREIPVIVPKRFRDGSTLGSHGSMHFAVFPKKGGRSFDEFSDDQWLSLGMLLARVHSVGALHKPRQRITLHPAHATREQIDYILAHDFMEPDQAAAFRAVTTELIDRITSLFAHCELIRIHGDCHAANFIHRPGESFSLIDFDDMAVGPPVHDFWMLLPGSPEECVVEIDLFLEGYETFRSFDRSSLRLIEPLRAMRFIHYIAWCAHQVVEDGSSPIIPDFGSRTYWQTEIDDLADQLRRIETAPPAGGNVL